MTSVISLPGCDADRSSPPAPRLADGVELFGEYEAGGFVEPTYLAARADGQVVQLSRLIYLVAYHLDGESAPAKVAERVSADFDRPVSAGNVEFLLEQRLAPLGLIAPPPGEVAPAPVAIAFFALGLRAALLPARAVRILTRPVLFLFHRPLVVAVLAALVAVDVWLFVVRGIGSELIATLTDPALLAVLGVLQIFTSGFHELGHAAACRYGGAKPGKIGAGIFLIWPVFYSDVTDSYRLNRTGRLRTDLAGVYFDAVATLLLAAAYAATGWDLLLVAIAFEQIDIAYQFVPFLRLDGYYMVSDLVGVPDLFGRIRPILRSLRPGRAPEPAVSELKPRVRVIVTVWVITSVAVITAGIGLLVVNTPAWFAEATAALARYAGQARASWTGGDLVAAAFSAGRAAMLLVPALGTGYMVYHLVSLRRRSKAVRRITSAGSGGRVTLDPTALGAYPFARQWRGYDRKEVKALLAAVARRVSSPQPEPSPGASDDELLDQAQDGARQIVEVAEKDAATAIEQARRAAEEVAQATIDEARQIYEDAVEEAAKMHTKAEQRAQEILGEARHQLDLAVELKLELRRELADGPPSSGNPLRVVPDPPVAS